MASACAQSKAIYFPIGPTEDPDISFGCRGEKFAIGRECCGYHAAVAEAACNAGAGLCAEVMNRYDSLRRRNRHKLTIRREC